MRVGSIARRRALIALVPLAVAACTRGVDPPRPPRIDRETLRDAAAIPIAELPRWTAVAHADYRQEVLVSVRDDVAGVGFEGRGVVVVRPRRALRMILVGPGGTTAMDTWIAGDRFRVAIPAIDRVVRGDGKTPRGATRGMPIALLKRWLMAPFDGQTMAAHRGRVRDDGSIDETDAVSFVVWTRRSDAFETRARIVDGGRIEGRAWWYEDHRLVATIVGEEARLGDAIVPTSAVERSFDPPMTVRVTAQSTVPVAAGELPDETFVDPDHGVE